MRSFSNLILFSALGFLFAGTTFAFAQNENTVAGRTVDQYVKQLNDPDRVVRLRAIRSLGALGEPAGDALTNGLNHQDAAVRYIAAVCLGRIAGPPLRKAKERLQVLADDETSLAVRIAASFALCRDGDVPEHLPLLVQTLKHPVRGVACSAAELIGQIGPDAAPAIEALEAAYKNNQPGTGKGDYHVGGASHNALRKVSPPDQANPRNAVSGENQ